jgi:hypothetical protein
VTNFEAWHHFMKDVISPTSFITMSYYSMISAALQRRVYLGSDERPLFPNMYIILVADPGVGKGVALDPVISVLKTHKLNPRLKIKAENLKTSEEQADALAALMAEMDTANSKEPNGTFKKLNNIEEPLLFPVAANSTTYEALVKTHAQSLRSIFPEKDKNSKLLKSGLYTHSSLSFLLEEMSSLFRKHTEDLVQYLIAAFDCKDYEYVTIGRGKDKVKNSCLNIAAGTTPSFMKESFSDKLLNDGFASRVIFVFEERNRFYRFDVSSLDDSQLEAKRKVIEHVGKLGTLFGKVSYSADAHAFMKHYIEVVIGENREKTNSDPKLMYYYSRKNIHVQKLALAMHFSESTEMVIEEETCRAAIAQLDNVEKKMHLALNTAARNPLKGVSDKVIKALALKPMSKPEIWAAFFSDISTPTELESLCEYLSSTGKVSMKVVDGVFKYVIK